MNEEISSTGAPGSAMNGCKHTSIADGVQPRPRTWADPAADRAGSAPVSGDDFVSRAARASSTLVPRARRPRREPPAAPTVRSPSDGRLTELADSVLEAIDGPEALRRLDDAELAALAEEIREVLIEAVSVNGGHLGSNLGAVELTLALHRVFDSPRDAIVWDTGHQTYVHKLVTGRLEGFSRLRQGGGMSGYPSRAESEHDIVENSHASTAVSYAYGLAIARDTTAAGGEVVAVIGDGALTGGL